MVQDDFGQGHGEGDAGFREHTRSVCRGSSAGMSSLAMRLVLAELGDAYERQSGRPVAIVSVGGVDAARRVDDGEAFDFVVLTADVIARLAADGRVDPGSRTDLARSAVA